MANTYQLIASSTVGSGGAATITFSSIPSTYTDLVLKLSCRTDRATGSWTGIYVEYNGSAGTAYSDRYMVGTGSSTSSATNTSQAMSFISDSNQATQTSNVFTSAEFYIPNYAGSANKSGSSDSVGENNGSSASLNLIAAYWANTSAINQIKLQMGAGLKFVQYTTAYLYGIKNS